MPLVVITIPPGIDEQMYDAVNAKLGDEMPDGLIVHTAGRGDSGEFTIIDVWEPREAHDRFSQGRLWGAIQTVLRDRGIDPEQVPEARREFFETHDLMVRQPHAAAH